MARAILTIEADASSVTRTLGGLRGEVRSAQAAITADTRAAARERAQVALEEVRQRGRIELEGVRASGRASAERTREAGRESQHRRRLDLETVRSARTAASDRTKVEVAGIRARATAAVQASREEIARQTNTTRLFIASERERTAATRREEAERSRTREREARRQSQMARQRQREEAALGRERGRTAGRYAGAAMTGARAVGAFASSAHGMIQGARDTAAARETALNTALVQTIPSGATAAELRGSSAYIFQQIAARHLDPDAAIEAINRAQSFANALGGNTAERRRAAIDATLGDVDFASQIDPENTSGLVKFGAMLRSRGVDETTRQRIMRGAVGISFAGSVEAEDALRGGLGGMLSALSTATANAPASQRDTITQDVVTDFLAQVQTVAMSGGSVRMTSNRATNLRTALSNPHVQDRLGQALARRQMTDEQRTQFNEVFRRGRDGKYTIDSAVASRPNEVAAMFGALFNNDATATRAFLGTHGGGGARQLLNRPEAELITSYFGMTENSRGESVRQYELQRELRGATLTPEQERELRAVRRGEDATTLRDNEAARMAALTNRNNSAVRTSNDVANMQARNPFAAAAIEQSATALGGILAPAVERGMASAVTRVLGATGGGGAAAMGVPGTAAGTALGVGGTALGGLAAAGAATFAGLAWGANDAGQNYQRGVAMQDAARRSRVESTLGIVTAPGAPAQPVDLSQQSVSSLVAALRSARLEATVDPHDAAQARSASTAGTRR